MLVILQLVTLIYQLGNVWIPAPSYMSDHLFCLPKLCKAQRVNHRWTGWQDMIWQGDKQPWKGCVNELERRPDLLLVCQMHKTGSDTTKQPQNDLLVFNYQTAKLKIPRLSGSPICVSHASWKLCWSTSAPNLKGIPQIGRPGKVLSKKDRLYFEPCPHQIASTRQARKTWPAIAGYGW